MALKYPESTVWFVQARTADGVKVAEGSAVAIRLQLIDKPDTAATYLLTCGHVVRESSDGRQGCGRLATVIKAWPPDVGFTEAQARPVPVASEIRKVSDAALAPAERDIGEDDWVVLQIRNRRDTLAADAVSVMVGDNLAGDFWVCGYLGSASLESNDKVLPIQTAAFPFHDADRGCFRLRGDGTRSGISGGGVFSGNAFVGIHRGRNDGLLELHGLAASYIFAKLYASGYEPVRQRNSNFPSLPSLTQPQREFGQLLPELLATNANWRQAFAKVLPPSSTYQISSATASNEQALLDALEHLVGLHFDENGVLPFFRFVFNLAHTSAVNGVLKRKLESLLGNHCSVELGDRLVPPTKVASTAKVDKPVAIKAEPRIVLRMSLSKDGAKQGQEFNYDVWFQNFPNSPAPQEHSGSSAEFNSVLERAWMAVGDQADPEFVWVELFLPKTMFSWAVEKEEVRIVAVPLRIGTGHRFVIRFDRGRRTETWKTRYYSARQRSQTANMPLCLDCSLTFAAMPNEPQNHRHFMVAMDAPVQKADLITMCNHLRLKKGVLGILWKSPPATQTASPLDVWDVVCETGVPLVAWLREIPPEAIDSNLTSVFHDVEWDLLVGKVQQLRLEAELAAHWHPGRHLAIILDDPKRPLPTSSSAACFQNPASIH